MLDISKAQEREERQGMGKGMVTSVFGLLLCWVPLLGLILSGAGFGRIVSRVTVRYKKRRALYIIVSFVILVASAAVLAGESYLYVQNPSILQDTGKWVYTKITGETVMPGEDTGMTDETDWAGGGGVDYDQTGGEGLGMDSSIYGYKDDEVWGYDAKTDIANQDGYVPESGN